MVGIYMILNKINGKIYVGQAVDIAKRWRDHKIRLRGNYHRNFHLQQAWNKYGENNFEFSVLCECKETKLNEFEQYYIFELNTKDTSVGYNSTYGGEGTRGHRHSKETIEYNRQWQLANNPRRGVKCSEETRKRMSLAQKGRKVSKEQRKHHSEVMAGRKLTDSHKRSISESNIGKHSSPRRNSKRVKCITTGMVFDSITEAANYYNVANSGIDRCCKGERKTGGKYNGSKLIWCFVEGEED